MQRIRQCTLLEGSNDKSLKGWLVRHNKNRRHAPSKREGKEDTDFQQICLKPVFLIYMYRARLELNFII